MKVQSLDPALVAAIRAGGEFPVLLIYQLWRIEFLKFRQGPRQSSVLTLFADSCHEVFRDRGRFVAETISHVSRHIGDPLVAIISPFGAAGD